MNDAAIIKDWMLTDGNSELVEVQSRRYGNADKAKAELGWTLRRLQKAVAANGGSTNRRSYWVIIMPAA